MSNRKITWIGITLGLIVTLALVTVLANAADLQAFQKVPLVTQVPPNSLTGTNNTPPVPPFMSGFPAQLGPVSLSPNLSYYFISGNTFTPDAGSSFYVRRENGCVNRMSLNSGFSAPVHLPQASQVVSITLFTYDTAITPTISLAYFIGSNAMGTAGYTISATSQANTAGYRMNTSKLNNPTLIDNTNISYYVQWRKSGASDSPNLSLCGVRVVFHPPLGAAAFFPFVGKKP